MAATSSVGFIVVVLANVPSDTISDERVREAAMFAHIPIEAYT